MSLFPLRKPEVFLSILDCFGFERSLNIVLLLDEGLSFHVNLCPQLLLQLIVKDGCLTQITLPSDGFIFQLALFGLYYFLLLQVFLEVVTLGLLHLDVEVHLGQLVRGILA